MNAKGEFAIQMEPQRTSLQSDTNNFSRLSFNKQFSGDMEGKSLGEMTSCRTNTEGSAGYVAMENFSGILAGKQGSFVLQHFGIMNAGDARLVLEVVPASGSGQLVGISGEMQIDIKDGKHFYTFDYELG